MSIGFITKTYSECFSLCPFSSSLWCAGQSYIITWVTVLLLPNWWPGWVEDCWDHSHRGALGLLRLNTQHAHTPFHRRRNKYKLGYTHAPVIVYLDKRPFNLKTHWNPWFLFPICNYPGVLLDIIPRQGEVAVCGRGRASCLVGPWFKMLCFMTLVR